MGHIRYTAKKNITCCGTDEDHVIPDMLTGEEAGKELVMCFRCQEVIKSKADCKRMLECIYSINHPGYHPDLDFLLGKSSVKMIDPEVFQIMKKDRDTFLLGWRKGNSYWEHAEEIPMRQAIDHLWRYRRWYNDVVRKGENEL